MSYIDDILGQFPAGSIPEYKAPAKKDIPFGQEFSERVNDLATGNVSLEPAMNLGQVKPDPWEVASTNTLAALRKPEQESTPIGTQQTDPAQLYKAAPDLFNKIYAGTGVPPAPDMAPIPTAPKFSEKDLLVPPTENVAVSLAEKGPTSGVKKALDSNIDKMLANQIAKATGLPVDRSFEEAVRDRGQLQGAALMAKGGQELAAALAGTKPIEGYGKELADMGAQRIADIFQKQQYDLTQDKVRQMKDASDPNSQTSQSQREMYRKMFKQMNMPEMAAKITDNLSSTQLEGAFGQLKIQHMMEQFNAAETRKEIAEANRVMRNEATKAKSALEKDKAYTEFDNKITAPRGNKGAQNAQQNLMLIENAMNNLDGAAMSKEGFTEERKALIAKDLARIATGGVPTESAAKMLNPETLKGMAAKLLRTLKSGPADAATQGQINQFRSFLNEYKNAANTYLRNFERDVFRGYKKRISPEAIEELKRDKPYLFSEKTITPENDDTFSHLGFEAK